jgi:hypothetical protein
MAPVRRDLPSGTVTFLFTDVEGSTKLLHELGAERYAEALAENRRTAARLLSSSMALHEKIGSRRFWVAQRNEETLATIRTQLDETAYAEAWEEGRRLTVDEAVALAMDS